VIRYKSSFRIGILIVTRWWLQFRSWSEIIWCSFYLVYWLEYSRNMVV